jgi:hypothetical protein
MTDSSNTPASTSPPVAQDGPSASAQPEVPIVAPPAVVAAPPSVQEAAAPPIPHRHHWASRQWRVHRTRPHQAQPRALARASPSGSARQKRWPTLVARSGG